MGQRLFLPVSPVPLGPSALFWGLARQRFCSEHCAPAVWGTSRAAGPGPWASRRGCRHDGNTPAAPAAARSLLSLGARNQGSGPGLGQPARGPRSLQPFLGGSGGRAAAPPELICPGLSTGASRPWAPATEAPSRGSRAQERVAAGLPVLTQGERGAAPGRSGGTSLRGKTQAARSYGCEVVRGTEGLLPTVRPPPARPHVKVGEGRPEQLVSTRSSRSKLKSNSRPWGRQVVRAPTAPSPGAAVPAPQSSRRAYQAEHESGSGCQSERSCPLAPDAGGRGRHGTFTCRPENDSHLGECHGWGPRLKNGEVGMSWA